ALFAGPRVDWRVDLDGGEDGEVTASLYEDAITAVCDLPEPALLAFPDLGLDLLALAEQAQIVRAAVARSEELKDRMVLTEVPAAGSAFGHPSLEPDVTVKIAAQFRAVEATGGARSAAL